MFYIELLDENYDSAYKLAKHMSDIYPTLPLLPIRALLECIIEKEKGVKPNQKCKMQNEK